VRTHSRYAIQAVLVYIAVGVALGMVGWALLIHDSGGGSADRTPAKVAPATGDSHK
jgi:hypothetical protein